MKHHREFSNEEARRIGEQTTGKIAWAHLNEFPDYYTRLEVMEADAERYWSERRGGTSS
jgi:hypothetical protein